MDIGTLTGAIQLDDELSGPLQSLTAQVDKFADNFDSAMKFAAASTAVLVTAVTSAIGAIVTLGNKGSVLVGVEESFDRLARAAGSTGEALVNSLSAGLRDTVDSMELMQATSRLLSSGMKVTEQQMELLGATARELGKATGTDATQALNTLSSALTTGNDRALKRLGIHVNLVEAERKFAASIGTTRDQLSQAGVLEARRSAMLEAMQRHLDVVGRSELTFKERIQQATVAVGNWFDELAKGVARSSAVSGAFDAIWESMKRVFGPTTQTLLQAILRGIDNFANGVANIGPKVIQIFGTITEKIMNLARAVGPALGEIGGIITDTIGTIGPPIVAAIGDVIDTIGKLATAATPALATLRSVISDAVSFAIERIQAFWKWLVDFNERWQITATLVAAGRAAWDLLRGAFDLVKSAVEGVMAAWRAMPEWLQRITQTALEATVVIGLYGAAISAAATPLANLVGTIDTVINIFGNLTGAIYATQQLLGTGGFGGAVVTLGGNFSKLIDTLKNSTVVMHATGIALVAMAEAEVFLAGETTAMTAGQKVLQGVLVTTGGTLHRVADALKLTTALEIAQTAATTTLAAIKSALSKAFTAVVGTVIYYSETLKITTALEYASATAKAVLTGALTLLGAAYTAITGEAVAAGGAITLSGAAAGAASIAITALGGALLVLQAALIPLEAAAIALAAVFAGKWVGSFPMVQNMVLSLAETFGLLGGRIESATLALLQFTGDLPPGGIRIMTSKELDEWNRWKEHVNSATEVAKRASRGFKPLTDDLRELTSELTHMGTELGKTGDELKRFVEQGLREHSRLVAQLTGSDIVDGLNAQRRAFASLTDDQKFAADVVQRYGQTLSDARAKGATLTAAEAALADEFERGNKARSDAVTGLDGLTGGYIKASTAADDFRKKIGDMQRVAAGVAAGFTELAAIEEFFSRLTPAMRDNIDVQNAYVGSIHQLAEGHRNLSATMVAMLDDERQRRLAFLESDKAALARAGVTQGLIEQMKRLGATEADIARQYGVSTAALSAYNSELQRNLQISHRIDDEQGRTIRQPSVAGKPESLFPTVGTAEQAMIDAGRTQREAAARAIEAQMKDANARIWETVRETQDLIDQRIMSSTELRIQQIEREKAAAIAQYDAQHALTGRVAQDLESIAQAREAAYDAVLSVGDENLEQYAEEAQAARAAADAEIAVVKRIAAQRAEYVATRTRQSEELINAELADFQLLGSMFLRTHDEMAAKAEATYETALMNAQHYGEGAIELLGRIKEAVSQGAVLDTDELWKQSRENLQRIANQARDMYEFMAQNDDMFSDRAIRNAKRRMEAAQREVEGVMSAWERAAQLLGGFGSLVSEIPNSFGQIAGAALQSASQTAAAFASGDIFGGIVQGAKTVIGLFKSISEAARDGRHAIVEFADSFDTSAVGSGFDELHAKLLQLGDAGEQFWIRLTQKTRAGDLEGAKKIIEEIKAALEFTPEGFGYKTAAELQIIADKTRQVWEYMVTSGQYTANQIADAFKRMQEAGAAAGDPAATFAQQASAAGYKTKAELEQIARQAVALWEYMRDSGMYSAEQVQDAWEKAQKALQESGNEAAKVLSKLDEEFASLQKSVSEEAEEAVMGVVEQQQRARMAEIEAERERIRQQQAMEEAAADKSVQTQGDAAQRSFQEWLDKARTTDAQMRDIMQRPYDLTYTMRPQDGEAQRQATVWNPPAGGWSTSSVNIDTSAAQQQLDNLQRAIDAVAASIDTLGSSDVDINTTVAQQQLTDLQRNLDTLEANIASPTDVGVSTVAALEQLDGLQRALDTLRSNADIVVNLTTGEAQQRLTDLQSRIDILRSTEISVNVNIGDALQQLDTLRTALDVVVTSASILRTEIETVGSAVSTLGGTFGDASGAAVEALDAISSSARTIQDELRTVASEASTTGAGIDSASNVAVAGLDRVSNSARILQDELRTVHDRVREVEDELSAQIWTTWGPRFADSVGDVDDALRKVLSTLGKIRAAIDSMPSMPEAPESSSGSSSDSSKGQGGAYPAPTPAPPPVSVPQPSPVPRSVQTVMEESLSSITSNKTLSVNLYMEGAVIRSIDDAREMGVSLATTLRRDPLVRELLGEEIINIVDQNRVRTT